jgi:hypothetical protein
VATARHRSAALLVGAAALLVGCGAAGAPSDSGTPSPTAAVTPTNDADAATLVELALVARGVSDIPAFAATLRQAAQVCADPQASARLDQVAAIAQRWADSLADGRPKVQATSEALLADVPWDTLARGC